MSNEFFSTHILDEENKNSYCRKAVYGDRGITLEQAQDPDRVVSYDCIDCYNIVFGSENGASV